MEDRELDRVDKQNKGYHKGYFALIYSDYPTAILAEGRSSVNTESRHKQNQFTKVQNTFKLNPDEPFYTSSVSLILKEELRCLENVIYEPERARSLSLEVCNRINARLKELDFTRHKLVSTITITENLGQGICAVSRCLWDKERDNFVFETFRNATLLAVACVFGVYYE